MPAFWIALSLLAWSAAAVLSSRTLGPIPLLHRAGRLFFAGSVVVVAALWLFLGLAMAERAGDSRVTAQIPRWYDLVVFYAIPNAMLAIGASAARGATAAGLFFRFKLYTLLGFDLYYLGAIFPWHVSGRQTPGGPPHALVLPDLVPLILLNLVSVFVFVLLAAGLYYLERQARNIAGPEGRWKARGIEEI